jgi:hypothetical protein
MIGESLQPRAGPSIGDYSTPARSDLRPLPPSAQGRIGRLTATTRSLAPCMREPPELAGGPVGDRASDTAVERRPQQDSPDEQRRHEHGVGE